LRSLNVVQIHTEGVEKCHADEAAAMASCPTEESIIQGQSREIMLYKTKELNGDTVIAQEYCPVNGRYVFTYSVNDGNVLENVNECHEPVSELSNCPYGFGLGLRFKHCSFGDLEINFQCLGDWIGHNGERYMALLDVQEPTPGVIGVEKRPRYRCALYKEDPETGKMYVALSSDSTCQNDLKSPQEGYETLVLTAVLPPPLPFEVSTSACRFPTWTHGQWQDAYVEADTLVYKDLRNFRTYTVKCMVEQQSNSQNQGHFVVYARTQCGDDFYTCMSMERRGVNVMEFQLGVQTSSNFNQSLCHNEKFTPAWVTQGRINVIAEESCPISGEYFGTIPDAVGLCAKLYSDCRHPHKLFYTVSNCFNDSEIYQEREYKCLGLWTDKGLTYTYTERRDIFGYECFVGVIINEAELFIKEAGENCQRDVEPLRLGMKLTRQAMCYTPRPSSKPATIASATTAPTLDIRGERISPDIRKDVRRPSETTAFVPIQSTTKIANRNPVTGAPKKPSTPSGARRSTKNTLLSLLTVICLLVSHRLH